ncbi:hypothetical protein DHX103_02605 [Planococcus sp. X10-3]|uniref:hypothetical protein n=1 Tax=Planococcus sp. X10-3 TaxID=3061240 RepID=UPI003BB120A5
MAWSDVMNMALPLVGVLIGGWITYLVQTKAIKENQTFELNKIKQENIQKDNEIKFQTYNKILLRDGTYRILVWDNHNGYKLIRDNYVEYVRPLLFEIYHLLEKEIADEFNNIEDIYDRQLGEEEPQVGDKEALSDSYKNIIERIKRRYREQHVSNQISSNQIANGNQP